MISQWWNGLSAPARFYLKGAAVAAVLLILFFGGPALWNRASNWWWGKGTERQKAEIQADTAEAQKWKGVAEGALGELEDAKRELAEERRKREEAEKVLADRRRVTEAARDAYDAALARPAPSPDFGASTSDLCERARRLGVTCPPE